MGRHVENTQVSAMQSAWMYQWETYLEHLDEGDTEV